MGSPLPPAAGVLNILIAIVWVAVAAFGALASGPVCAAPAAFALFAAALCFRRTHWGLALLFTVLSANAISAGLLVLSKEDFAAPTARGP